jgi:hypothetical protein
MRKKSSWLIFSATFFILLTVFSSAFAQAFSFSFFAGYNHSQLINLKNATRIYESKFWAYNIPVSAIDNFPPYLFVEPRVNWRFSQNSRFGLHFLYTSTGSRVRYFDYSGELKQDQVVELYAPGVSWEYLSISFYHMELWIVFDCSYLYSKYDASTFFRLEDEQEFSHENYSAKGFALEPGMQLTYPYGRFLFHFRMDYRFAHSSRLSTRKNGKTEYFILNDSPVPIQWGGWLWGIGIGFRLGTVSHDAP